MNPIISQSRVLAWDACANARDLGGYPLHGGGQTRWKTLVRSDSTSYLTASGQQALIDYGIRTIIDLRFHWELEKTPSPFAGLGSGTDGDRPLYFNIPLDVDQDLAWPTEASPAEAMCDLSCRIIELNRQHIAAVLTAIARARPGGVLFHCHAGKDRTGWIASMILGAVGVPRDVIIEDYALTQALLKERREQDLANQDLTPDRRAYKSILTTALPETMRLTLDYLDRQYGGVEGYLHTTPLLPADLESLRQRLVSSLS